MRFVAFTLLLSLGCAGQGYGDTTNPDDLFDEPIVWHDPTPGSQLVIRSESEFVPAQRMEFYDQDNKLVGAVDWSKGELTFEGDVDRSAQAFFETFWITYVLDEHP